MSLSGAWSRFLRHPASPSDPSCPGGALWRGVAGGLDGIRRPGRAAVLALACLALLSGAATPAHAQSKPTVSFEPVVGLPGANARTQWVKEDSGTHNLKVTLNPAPTSPLTVTYKVSGNANSGSDYTPLSGTLSVPAGATTATIPVTIIDDNVGEGAEEIAVWIDDPVVASAAYRLGRPSSHHLIIDPSDGPPWVSFARASRSADEGSGTHDVGVRVHPAPSSHFTLSYTVEGTATSGSDYTALSGTVTVAKDATTATIPVTIIDDNVREDSETVVLKLIGSSGYQVESPGTHTLTIAASDKPTVSFASASGSADEGSGTRNVTVNLTPAPASDIALSYTVDGTATSGSDYTALSGTLSVPKGATTATIPVKIIDDSSKEGSETVVLKLSGSADYQVGSPSTHVLTILDNDDTVPTVSFAYPITDVQEQSATHNVEVKLDPAPTTDITLNYSVADTATPGLDYEALPGTVAVPKGAKSAIIPIKVFNDNLEENTERIFLELVGGTGYRLGNSGKRKHYLYIENNDIPRVTFTQNVVNLNEGSGTHHATLTLDRVPKDNKTIKYKVDGIALPGSDYTALSGTVTVPKGTTTATIPVTIIDDGVFEGGSAYRESIGLDIVRDLGLSYRQGNPSRHVIFVADNDTRPTKSVFFARGPSHDYFPRFTAGEGSGTHNAEVRLVPAPTTDITLAYSVGGTATPGSDFTIANSGTLSVPAGAKTANIPVKLVDDSAQEGSETVVLTLVDSAGYGVRQPETHTLTVLDDETPTMFFASASRSAGEGSGTHNAEVRLIPAPTTDITLAYRVGGTAIPGSDFTIANSGTLSVPAGTKRATIPVALIDDSMQESIENVVLRLVGSAGYGVRQPEMHVLFVIDDDPAPASLPAVSVSAGVDATEGGDAVFTVAADPAPAAPLAVTVTVAVAGDYGVIAGDRTVTIPTTGSATLTLATSNDGADEADGSVTATVKDGEGYTVGSSASGTVAIADDDPASVETVTPAVDPALVAQVRGYAAETHQGQEHVDRWMRVLAAFGDDNGYTAMTAAEAQTHADKGWQRWVPVVAALAALEAPPLTLPAVSVSAGADVTEGGDAVFTVTANPAPAAALSVTVTVATAGEFGVTAGSRPVTIPTTGSATLTLATANDDADEPDGSVSVTVAAGDGYTVGDPASGTVAIADDDPAPPAVATAVDPALVAQVRGYAAETHEGQAHVDRWKRVLAAFGDDNGYTAMTAAEAQIHADKGWQRWVPVVAALEALEAAQQPLTLPAVSVSAGADVTEGGDAVFTVTASPAPAAELAVTVTVATAGEFGVTAGSRSVTIPTGGSATLTLTTTGDEVDEADGSVSVTVNAGEGYTVGSPASGTVAIADNDDAPLPAVTVSAGADVTEGGGATFTVTANPAPASPLAVSMTVAVDGDYGVTAGSQSVTIPATGSATLTLATTGDEVDEPDGSVTATVAAGDGYTVGDPASGTVAVRDDDEPLPVIAVSAGGAVTEGGDATFTVTASPAPASPLTVSVTVAAKGDYGIAAGTQTVSIPTTGSATLTLATANDDADEPDGSATLTVNAGDGYTVGSPASGSVSIADDDLPPPVVSIAAKAASVTEGGAAAFTLTADRAPDADLTVTLSVAETGGGDHVAAADEGPATATIAKGATEAVFSVATVDDDVDEPDGSVTVTLKDGGGYTVSPSQGTAAVTVSDNDAAALPSLSVDDVTVKEGAWMEFTVRLSAPSAGGVSVKVSTRDSTPVSATARDYWPLSGRTVSFRAGETERSVGVIVYDDSHDEEAETFEFVLSDARGAAIADGVAVGTITNDDPMPAAWLARFGRTVAEQALDGIAGRMSADRTPGMRGSIAGQALSFDPAANDNGSAVPAHAPDGAAVPGGTGALALADVAQAFGGQSGHSGPGVLGHDAAGFGSVSGAGFTQSQTMTAREALLGSSFSLTGQADGSGGSMAFWGRAAQGSFDGREGTFSLDGAVTTGMLGADYARGKWLVGLALAQSTGEGDYRDSDAGPRPDGQSCPEGAGPLCDDAVRAGDGEVEASLTAAIPYAALQASERLKLWGAAGYGSGEVTLKTAMGGSYSSDTSWSMAAAGLRGELLAPPAEGSGLALAVTSDALWTRTSSEKTRDLAASESDATRLRLGLEGSYRMALESGGHLTPKLEIGARHDGGDAETGFGVELGGGIAWSDPGLGLSLDVSGRTLIAHGNDDLKDRGYAASLAFDPDPATKRGPSLSLRQEFGGQAQGGLDALFNPAPPEDRTGSEATSRWTMEAAYGFPAFGGRFTGSPHVGLGLSTSARDYSLGWRLTPEAASAPDLSFGLKATRRESDTAAPEHTVGLEATMRW